MPNPEDRYCSDCAWPYECAARQSCHRRDLGEVRGRMITGLPDREGRAGPSDGVQTPETADAP